MSSLNQRITSNFHRWLKRTKPRHRRFLKAFICLWMSFTLVLPPDRLFGNDDPPDPPPTPTPAPGGDCNGSGANGSGGCKNGSCSGPNSISFMPAGKPAMPGGGTQPGDDPDTCSCPIVSPMGTTDPIYVNYGAVYEKATDINIGAPGMGAATMRSYASNAGGNTTLGTRWLGGLNDTVLYQTGPIGGQYFVSIVINSVSKRIFTTYDIRAFDSSPDSSLTLTGDGSGHFILTDYTSNMRWVFNDYTGSNTALRGKLVEKTTIHLDAQSLPGFAYSYNTDGTVSQITTTSGQDYTIACTYNGSKRLTQLQVKDASANLLQQVNYTYYQDVTSPTTDLGATNDLVQVKIASKATNDSSGTLSIVRYTQYRYSGLSQIKAVYEHADLQRMMSTLSLSTPETVMTKADTFGTPQVKTFASRSFTYYSSNVSTASINTPFTTSENLNTTYGGTDLDETGRVATETIAGCGSCSTTGSITKSYFYMMGASAGDQNVVMRLIVEDTQDSAGTAVYRNVYGLETSGRKLRSAFIQNPITSPVYWCESWKMATTGPKYRLAEHRNPSAHTGVTTAANLRTFLAPYDLSSWSNDTATVNSSSGLIETYSYNSTGMLTDSFVKNGNSGTAYYVSASDYGDSTNTSLVTADYTYPTQTTSRTSGKATSYSYTFYDSTKHQQIKTRTTTFPTISTTQNGSGVATTNSEYYDNLGRLRWTQDGEGYINYYSYNPTTGGLAYTAVDVDPASPGSEITSGSSGNWVAVTVAGASSNQPTRSSSLPTPLSLTTKRFYDSMGRPVQTTDSGGSNHFAIYSNTQTIQFPYWDSTTGKSQLPISVTNFNSSGVVTDSISVRASYSAISTSGSKPTGFSTAPTQSDYVAWTHNTFDSVGRLSYVDNYATIPTSGAGTLGSDFYRSVTQYDSLGRTEYSTQVIRGSASNNRVEQVSQVVYDVLDRIVQVNMGVSGDTAANSHDMTDSYSSYPTLRTISQTVYDNGTVGDSNVTKTRQYFGTSSTSYTGVNYLRTYRGHLRGREPFYVNSSTETPMGPYIVNDLDWFGRATTTAYFDTDPTWSTVLTGDGYSAYASTTTSHRRSQRDSLFDDMGRLYQTKRYEISSSTGTGTNYLSQQLYYNRNSRIVASANQYAAGTELAYDGAGRAFQARTVVALQSTPYSSGAYDYCAPVPKPSLSSMSGGDGGVLELAHAVFDTYGNTIEADSFENNHDDLSGGSVGINLTNNNDYVRRTTFAWYDAVGRATTIADFGSGDTTTGAGKWKYASLPTRPTTVPTSSSYNALVSLLAYNSDSGYVELTTDPAGTPKKVFYDRLGRTTYSAANFSDFNASTETGTGDSTDKSKDTVTKLIYEGLGRVKQLVALDANADGTLSDNQATTYLYEDAVNANWKTNEIYPDSSDTTSAGTNQIKFAFNVDGSLSQRTDQRGTVIAYNYGNSRYLANQSVSTLGTGVDGAVRSIGMTYDNLNRVQNITSYASTAATGTVVNDLQFEFNDLNQTTKIYQSHSGAVNTSTTPKSQLAYDTGVTGSAFNAQHRQQTLVYPDGRTIYYDYGTSGSVYSALSCLREIWDGSPSGTGLAIYDYNGAGSRHALTTLPQPSLKLDHFQGTSSTYAGLDRFGRVVDQYWKGFNTTSDVDRFRYAYDYASRRTYRDIDSSIYSTNDLDQAYTYDGLHRLNNSKQGTLSGTTISGTPKTEENWVLDALGNWPGYVTKALGTINLNQSRSVNPANEITGVTASVGTTWATPAYDAAGNMTTMPQPANPGSGYTATYDAWNRLVKLVDATNSQTVQQNQYDGRNYRVVIQSYTGGVLSETRHSYFSLGWRCIEERTGSSTTADRQFVWGGKYVDELLLRDRGSERLYAMQDANWNVTSLTDGAGVVKERFSYSSYGSPTYYTGSFGSRSSSAYSWETLFAGYRFDAGTGLYNVRFRPYHPILGTWVSRDPIRYATGANLFEYGHSAPSAHVDPFGLAPNRKEATSWDDIIARAEELEEEGLTPMQVINALANEFGNEKNNKRYVETGKYGWIDLKHFFTAAKYGNDYGQWITEGLGWLNELNQYMNEGPNDYKSGFSYEDLPSNSAGADFGRRRWWGGGKVSGALGNWSDGADGVNIGDPGSTYGNLPPTDPNLPKGGGGGSNSSNNNPAGGSNSNSSNPPPPNNTPPKGSTSSCPPQQKPKPKKKNGSNSGSNSSNNGNNANSSSSGS